MQATTLEQGLRFEIALEKLSQKQRPYLHALREERAKAKPSEKVIGFCEKQMALLEDLQHDLMPDDFALISLILDKHEG